jgi:hypothetical protein
MLAYQDNTRDENEAALEAVLKNPGEGAKKLLGALHPIEETKLNGPDNTEKDYAREKASLKVIHALQMLCVITGGKTFTSPSEYAFPKPAPGTDSSPWKSSEEYREYWLTRDGRDKMPFFAQWPSRGVYYIAPIEVQEAVILQWNEWFEKEGASYNYRAVEDFAACGI